MLAGATSAVATLGACAPGDVQVGTPSFVLVHGSASNSFFWTPLVRELALLGRRSLPVDLPGHGADSVLPSAYQAPQDPAAFAAGPSVVGDLSLEHYVDHVAGVVEAVAEHGPVVLVGHSLGGSVLTGVANRAPELLDGLTYVSAFCCTELDSPLDYLSAPEARDGAAPPAAASLEEELLATVPKGTSRYNWRSSDRTFLSTARAQLMGDATEEEFLAAISIAQQPDESIQASLDAAKINPDTWGRIPRAYVRLTQDRLNTPALQDRMIIEADRAAPERKFEQADIATSHLGVYARSRELAQHLHRLWP